MTKNAMHNDSLQLLNEQLFAGVLTHENVTSEKRSIKIDDEKSYGFFLKQGRYNYFLQDYSDERSVLDDLPIRVTDKIETDYNKSVFYFITGYDSVKIPTEKKITFRETIDAIANFKHTNPEHWLLYKIITVAGWCDRINYRVIAERGFGKDSAINNVQDLVHETANIYGATFAKLEYSLKHKLLIFNEMGNLKADEKHNMQQFLLAIGAFFNRYVKRSRATGDGKTKEEYDISKQSLGIIYNPPIYYVEKGQEFFDVMFTKAVLSRFIPFYVEGRLDEKFDAEFDVRAVISDNIELYRNLISTLRYYRNTEVRSTHLLPPEVQFDDTTRRFERSCLKIADYISEYAGDDSELFSSLTRELYECYTRYDSIVQDALARIQ
jgi:hypothetical protein